METRTLMQIGAIAAMLGGVSIFLAGVLDFGLPDDEAPFSEIAVTGLWMGMTGAMFAGAFFLVLAMPAFYLLQAPKARAWATAAYVAGSVGFLILVGLAFALAFAAPTLAAAAPAVMDSEDGPGGPLGIAFMVGFPLFLVTLLFFSGVTLWAGVLPRAAAALVLAGGLLDVVTGALSLPIDGRIVAGVGFAWLGWAAWSLAAGPPAAAPTPAATA